VFQKEWKGDKEIKRRWQFGKISGMWRK
jgi:hypothetical protein